VDLHWKFVIHWQHFPQHWKFVYIVFAIITYNVRIMMDDFGIITECFFRNVTELLSILKEKIFDSVSSAHHPFDSWILRSQNTLTADQYSLKLNGLFLEPTFLWDIWKSVCYDHENPGETPNVTWFQPLRLGYWKTNELR
jgi:hypothetical protein